MDDVSLESYFFRGFQFSILVCVYALCEPDMAGTVLGVDVHA